MYRTILPQSSCSLKAPAKEVIFEASNSQLSPSETVRPPQPARLQSQADSFYSRGPGKNVSPLVSTSPDDFSPASCTKSKWTRIPEFKKSLKRSEPWLLVDLYTKPHPSRNGACVALTRQQPETADETYNSMRAVFLSRELNSSQIWLWYVM